MNHEISNLIKNVEERPQDSNTIKTFDIDSSQSADKHEKIFDEELINPKDYSKEDSFNKKENDNDDLNTSRSKEKNIITVDLSNDEKIVFSQLGINPLIKLGKEYLTSNNFVRLKDNINKQEKNLDNKKSKAKQIKKLPKSKEEEVEIKNESNANSKDKIIKKTNENNEIVSLDNKGEFELKDEMNNSRKKRRRSSAIIE